MQKGIKFPIYPYQHASMKHPSVCPESRNEFWEDYRNNGFAYAAKKYVNYEVK